MSSRHDFKIEGWRLVARFRNYFRSLLAILVLCFPSAGFAIPSSGTAPFVFDNNRIYAELVFVRPDGRLYKTLAFVDLGSPSMILSEALFKELQIDAKKPLVFKVGDMPVRVDSNAVASDTWLPFSVGNNRRVEALLPAGIMQRYEVVIDYARRTLTLAQPGTLKPQGIPLPCRLNEKTGLIAVDASINGRTYAVTIDNGSAYSWLRKATVQKWLAAHPDWQRGTGAVGASNMR